MLYRKRGIFHDLQLETNEMRKQPESGPKLIKMNGLPNIASDKRYKWLEDTRAELYHRMDALEQAQRDVDSRLEKLEKSVEQSLSSVHSCIDDLLSNLNKDDKNEKNNAHLPSMKIKKEHEDSLQEDAKTSPLVLAAQAGDLAAVKDLVLAGVIAYEKNEKGGSVLEIAAGGGYFEITKLLLEDMYNIKEGEVPSAEVKKQLEGALIVAGNSSITKLLIDKVDPKVAVAAVHRAAQEGRVTTLHELLSSGVSANEVDKSGLSALHLAASEGHLDCVEVLLEFGAKNGYVGGPMFQTPLHLAAEKGHASCLDVLLKSGSHCINLRDRLGSTALLYAVSGNFSECVRVLLSHGAKVFLCNTQGEAPLHKAACLTSSERNNDEDAPIAVGRRKEILKMLLDAGAKPYVKSEDSRTAFDEDGAEALRQMIS